MQLPAKEWLCSDCEFLIFGIDDTLVDHAAGFDEELRRHIIENPEEICIP